MAMSYIAMFVYQRVHHNTVSAYFWTFGHLVAASRHLNGAPNIPTPSRFHGCSHRSVAILLGTVWENGRKCTSELNTDGYMNGTTE